MFKQPKPGRKGRFTTTMFAVVAVCLLASPGAWAARAFDQEALYGLLVAELALRRNEYELALDHYVEQARRTRDPGVVSQAARIADYLDRDAEAREMADLWLEIDPGNADALRFAAMQHIKAGEWEKGLEYLSELRQLQGSAVFGSLARQAQDLDAGDRERLLAGLDRLLESAPDDLELVYAKALLLLQADRLDEALPLLKRAFSAGESVSVGFTYARALGDSGDLDAAVAVLRIMQGWAGDTSRVGFTLGRMLLDGGRLDEAREVFEALLAADPRDSSVRMSLAYIALEQERFGDARVHLAAVAGLGEQISLANYYLGLVAEAEGKPLEAISHYEEVDGADEFLAAQGRVVEILAEQGRLPEARARLADLRARQAADPVTLFVIERELLLDARKPELALELVRSALERYPDDVSLLYAHAMTLEKLDDIAGLERELHRILAMEPDNAVVLNALGYTLADRTERYEEAHALIVRALELDPTDAAFVDSLGWVQYRLMHYDEALRLLRQAYRDLPDHEVAAHLGEVLWVTGSRGEALNIWREAFEREPDSEILKRVMERFVHSSAGE
jgi:tetratricopeptide (TPR) repeat protein